MDTRNPDKQVGYASNAESQPEAPHAQGRLLVFKRRPPNLEPSIDGPLLHREPFGDTERKAAQLISKHAPKGWQFRVGDHVAGRSADRIVQGIILGTKWKPQRPAAFFRDAFTACWLLLDNGEKLVANELRPVS